MMDTTNTTAKALEDLGAKAVAADPTDRDSIAEIGSEAETVREHSPELPESVDSALAMCLEVLQAAYEGSAPDPAATLDCVAMTATTAAEMLQDPDSQEARNHFEGVVRVLQGLAAPWPGQGEDAAPEPCDDQACPPAEEESVADPGAPSIGLDLDTPLGIPEDADMDLLREFIVECLEHLSGAEAAMLELETCPEDDEQINVIFRAFHTIKGTSGFLGLDAIQRLAHLAENMLDRVRDGEIEIRGGYADLALESCDMLRTMIEALRGCSAGDPLETPASLGSLLTTLLDPEAAGVTADVAADEMRLGDILVGNKMVGRKKIEQACKNQGDKRLGEKLVKDGFASVKDVAKALRIQNKVAGAEVSEATIRVATGRLDSLSNMVGELVIAHSMVAQETDSTTGVAPRLARNVSHSGKIIRELQDLSTALRMVPLKPTFQKMARLVRDLARKAGKQVRFVTEGDDTEIDRNMGEVINDPLVHMMRNALDHGVEGPEERIQAGKDPQATVALRAYHSGGNVVIELSDNGRGINRERIVAKAIERGLIASGTKLSDSEAFGLIFRPGFSTAEKITDISGRGVGMDVVRQGIDSLRGRIEVSSTFGVGSTFTVHVPLTMAITDAMLVRVGGQRYLVPTVCIEESIRPEAKSISTVTGKGEMVLIRGELLPVFRLHRLFGIDGAKTDPCQSLLIIIEGQDKRCALMVDELMGQQQVVIKSLGQVFGAIPGVSGGAILGDGRVGLILDTTGLLALAGGGSASGKKALAGMAGAA